METSKNNKSLFSPEYLEFVKKTGVKDLTNNQAAFAEWALKEENAKMISAIGGMEKMFVTVRKYLKDK